MAIKLSELLNQKDWFRMLIIVHKTDGTVDDVCNSLGCSEQTAERKLRELLDNGILTKTAVMKDGDAATGHNIDHPQYSSLLESVSGEIIVDDCHLKYCGECGKGPMSEKGVKIHASRMHDSEEVEIINEEPDGVDDEENDDEKSVDRNESSDEPPTSDANEDTEDRKVKSADDSYNLDKADVGREVLDVFIDADNAEENKKEKYADALIAYFTDKDRGMVYVKAKQVSNKTGNILSANQVSSGFSYLLDNPVDELDIECWTEDSTVTTYKVSIN